MTPRNASSAAPRAFTSARRDRHRPVLAGAAGEPAAASSLPRLRRVATVCGGDRYDYVQQQANEFLQLLLVMDVHHSGRLSYDEWTRGVLSQPDVLSCFTLCLDAAAAEGEGEAARAARPSGGAAHGGTLGAGRELGGGLAARLWLNALWRGLSCGGLGGDDDDPRVLARPRDPSGMPGAPPTPGSPERRQPLQPGQPAADSSPSGVSRGADEGSGPSCAGGTPPRVLMATKHVLFGRSYPRELTISATTLTTLDPEGGERRETNSWALAEIVEMEVEGTALWLKLPGTYAPPQLPTTLEVPCESAAAAEELAALVGRPAGAPAGAADADGRATGEGGPLHRFSPLT